MSPRATTIHALQQKILIFAEVAFPEYISARTPECLAEAAGVIYDSLKSAWNVGRISEDMIAKLAKFGRFESELQYFLDPNVPPNLRLVSPAAYTGRDTLEAFRALLMRTLKDTAESTRIVGRPNIRNRNVAWFQIDDAGQARVRGSVSELFLAVGIDTAEYDDILVGLTAVRIRLTLPANSDVVADRLLGIGSPAELSGAYISAKSASTLPEWTIANGGAVLEGEFVTSAYPLLHLAGLRLNEEFVADFSFRPSRHLHVLTEIDEPLSVVKKRVIGALFVDGLPDAPDREGWVSLGEQRMTLVRGDQVVL